MKIYRIAQNLPNMTHLPSEYYPDRLTTIVRARRLLQVNRQQNVNKHYIVCIYAYNFNNRDNYTVIAYNGRIGSGLTMQPKGLYVDLDAAQRTMNQVIRTKLAGGYTETPNVTADDLRGWGVKGRMEGGSDPVRPNPPSVQPQSNQPRPPPPQPARPQSPNVPLLMSQILNGHQTMDGLWNDEFVRAVVSHYMVVPVNVMDNNEVLESFIHKGLHDPQYVDLIKGLPSKVFSSIRMVPEDRELVEKQDMDKQPIVKKRPLSSLLASKRG